MKSTPHDIFSVFVLLRDFGMCHSEFDYSVEWLGRSKTYLAYLRSSKNYPCVEALVHLSARLMEASANLISTHARSAELQIRAVTLHDLGAAILRSVCRQALALSRGNVT